jgi:formamidopyrimidine-DNA glycosylase
MPEYPDLTVYVEALLAHVAGEPLEAIRIQSPSLLKSVAPPPASVVGRRVESVFRMGNQSRSSGLSIMTRAK